MSKDWRNSTNNKDNNVRSRRKPAPQFSDNIAEDLLAFFREQANMFLSTDPEERADVCETLFAVDDSGKKVTAVPGHEDQENLVMQRVDHMTRMDHNDPTTHGRLTAEYIVTDKNTALCVYRAVMFISKDDDANVRVIAYDEKLNRRGSVHWDTRG